MNKKQEIRLFTNPSILITARIFLLLVDHVLSCSNSKGLPGLAALFLARGLPDYHRGTLRLKHFFYFFLGDM